MGTNGKKLNTTELAHIGNQLTTFFIFEKKEKDIEKFPVFFYNQ